MSNTPKKDAKKDVCMVNKDGDGDDVAEPSPIVTKGKGGLRDVKLIIDNREHELMDQLTMEYTVAQLPLGDVIIGYSAEVPIVVIERKSFADLFAIIKDTCYNEQSYQLAHSSGVDCTNVIYMLEGDVASLNEEERNLLYSCIKSIISYKGVCVLQSSSLDQTAKLVMALMKTITRDLKNGRTIYYNFNTAVPLGPRLDKYVSVGMNRVKGANNLRENIGAIMLSQIPGIDYLTAEAIMKPYGGVFRAFYTAFMETNGKNLDGIKNKNGCNISEDAISNIKTFLV
jgi:ERCC4-type nuclease